MTLEIGWNLATVLGAAVVAFVIDRWWAYSALRNRRP
jgi:hypothetical protein